MYNTVLDPKNPSNHVVFGPMPIVRACLDGLQTSSLKNTTAVLLLPTLQWPASIAAQASTVGVGPHARLQNVDATETKDAGVFESFHHLEPSPLNQSDNLMDLCEGNIKENRFRLQNIAAPRSNLNDRHSHLIQQ
jgi:hypothetical protein